jgi:hypothetical protein
VKVVRVSENDRKCKTRTTVDGLEQHEKRVQKRVKWPEIEQNTKMKVKAKKCKKGKEAERERERERERKGRNSRWRQE